MLRFKVRRTVAGIGLSVAIVAVGAALATSATGAGAAAARLVSTVVDHSVGTANVAAGKPGGGGTSGTSGTPGLGVTIAPSGIVSTKGLVIDVPITIACVSPIFGGFITASQSGGHVVAQASGSLPPVQCDGTSHTFVARLLAQNVPFKPGVAVVTVNVDTCNFFFCGQSTAQATVRLVHG